MQWDVGVASAISTAKGERSPLLVLVEPPDSVTSGQNGATESPSELYRRLATRSLHKRLFSNTVVLRTISLARLRCVRFPADSSNSDYASFSTFFSVKEPTPNLFLISPDTGLVLYRLCGYVSPIKFQHIVAAAVKTVSGRIIDLPRPSDLKSSSTLSGQVDSPPRALQDSNVSSVTGSVFPAGNTSSASSNNSGAYSSSELPLQPSPAPAETGNTKNSVSKSLKLPGHARVRARLPDGRQIERRFDAGNRFHVVRAWLQEELTTADNIVVSTAFPRYVFTTADNAKSLTELKLIPSTSLVVSHDVKTDGAPSLSSRPIAAATSAISVVSSFVRSFFTPPVPLRDNEEGDDTHNASLRGPPRGETNNDSTTAIRMNRGQRANESDDQLWLSNGNSTQFGWNSADVDDERE